MNNSEEYRKLLIKEIEATGTYLLENAEKMVKDVDFIYDLNINLNFSSMDDMGSCPTIEIRQLCFNDSAVKVLREYQNEKAKANINKKFGVELVKGLGQFVGDNYDKVINNDQT